MSDLALGEPKWDDLDDTQNVGEAWVVSGASVSGVVDVLVSSFAAIEGDAYADELGRSLAGGDLDGDGRGDVLVSSPFRDDYAERLGRGLPRLRRALRQFRHR